MKLPVIQKEMVHEFQCPGCGYGDDPKTCKQFKLNVVKDDGEEFFTCANHAPCTASYPYIGKINLGLPKGFNRIGAESSRQSVRIRLRTAIPEFNKFNVAVWAMEKDGYLFVRTYCPRLNLSYIDVVKDGKISELPATVINVGEFIDEID